MRRRKSGDLILFITNWLIVDDSYRAVGIVTRKDLLDENFPDLIVAAHLRGIRVRFVSSFRHPQACDFHCVLYDIVAFPTIGLLSVLTTC